MNKNELITFIRNPNSLTDADLGELEEIVKDNPYFLNGRFLLAKGSKDLKHPDTKKRVASAAVYSTDRPLFKKYLSDKLFFLSQPPEEEEIEPEIAKDLSASKSEPLPSNKKKETSKKSSDTKDLKEESKKRVSDDSDSKEIAPRREPRFDPTATASFQRRWDTKTETNQTSPEPEKKSKSASKITFTGKKIDRSKRTKKKSIRSEILGENVTEKAKQEKPAAKREQPISKEVPPTSRPVEKKKLEKEVESKKKGVQKSEVKGKSQSKPKDQKSPSSISKSPKKEVDKEKLIKSNDPESKPRSVSPSTSQSEIKKPVAKRSPEAVSRTLDTPKMPSGGIDAILAELKKDMLSLKSSRVKFAEVQQKIEEDDAVSAALERATNKIPVSESKTNLDENSSNKPTSDSDDVAQIDSNENELESLKEEVEEKSASKKKVEDKEVKDTIAQKEGVEDKEVKDAIAQKEEVEDKEVKDAIAQKEEVEEKEQKIEKKEPKTPVAKEEEEEESAKKVTKKEKEDTASDQSATKKSKTNIMPKAKKVTPSKKKTTKKEKQSKKVDTKSTTSSKKETKEKPTKKKTEKKTSKDSSTKKKGQDDIIDKFIAETPSIKYQKKTEPTENIDLSDVSTEWNKELASEYLAEIYLHQGNKKRAIEIYKALSLKFPDKKSYFADLISKSK